MNVSEHVRCPDCRGDRLIKYGKTKRGLQKYRCLDVKCRRQFVAGSEHTLDPLTKEAAMKLIKSRVPPGTIAQALPDISLRWINELKRRSKGQT